MFDVRSGRLKTAVTVPNAPSGLAISADGRRLYVTCAEPSSQVCVVDTTANRIVAELPADTASAPLLTPDGKTLFVCNRFDNEVAIFNLDGKRGPCRIAVRREPIAADLTKDGEFLLVANRLPTAPSDADYIAASITVINVAATKVVNELRLPKGSGGLNDLRVSPDGNYAVVTHLVAQFNRPTTHAYAGWMNANCLSVIDLRRMAILATVQLDDPESGAANPWGLAWSPDSAKLVVTHAGTQELSIINFPALLANLDRAGQAARTPSAAQGFSPEPHDDQSSALNRPPSAPDLLQPLPFGVRQRIKLPKTDLGPRAVAIVGHTAYTANYFSDTLSAVDLAAPYPHAESILLGSHQEMSRCRKGEFYFHSATICFQGWQSCSSCHPGDARADGFNWDLLNDGVGNPKNTKSLLLAHQTPPSMWLGVRETAETAVRSGIRHILFTKQPEEVALAIDEYLKSLKPVPSPHLVHGKLSKPAERGKAIFASAGCATCHPPGLFTDLHQYHVGTGGQYDKPTDRFDTPALIEVWRTAPYLHDGSAITVHEVLSTRNRHDRHGRTSTLTSQELNDLCEYVLSL